MVATNVIMHHIILIVPYRLHELHIEFWNGGRDYFDQILWVCGVNSWRGIHWNRKIWGNVRA